MTEIDELREQYRRTLKLLVQSMSHTATIKIGEAELHEALTIAEDVITQRLTDDQNLGHEEWKGDAKKKYAHLFRSIHGEIDLALQRHFSVSDRNFVARQFLGHVVEPLLGIFKLKGPDSIDELSELLDIGHETIENRARDYSTEDAMIAKHILVTAAKNRTQEIAAAKRRVHAKQARLTTIQEVAEALRT